MSNSPFSYHISPDPMDRVPDAMKKILDDPAVLYDIHCHLFNYKDVPNGFIGMRIPMTQRFLVRLEKFLHKIKRRTDTDKYSNIASFLHRLHICSSEELANELADYYPGRKSILTPLLLDMETGIKGKVKRSYGEQIQRMKTLRDQMPDRLLPFVNVDPNNPDALKIFEESFSDQGDFPFFGVKLYPSLGYLPSHPVLMKIFAECEEKNIPVTGHCGGARVHHSKKWLNNIQGLRQNEKGEWVPFKDKKFFWGKNSYSKYFNDPKNWEPVLANFPKLKLNLAHFGGVKHWEQYVLGNHDNRVSWILDMMRRYEFLYADFSYTFHVQEFNYRLKEMIEGNQLLRKRVLFGSDFYMVMLEGKYRHILADFLTVMGDQVMDQISVENPKAFLFGRVDIPIKKKRKAPRKTHKTRVHA